MIEYKCGENTSVCVVGNVIGMIIHGFTHVKKTVFMCIETLQTLMILEKVKVERFGHYFTYRETLNETLTRYVFVNSTTLEVYSYETPILNFSKVIDKYLDVYFK